MSSTTALPPTPRSPGLPSVGARRKGPKQLPTLPLSAFSPPNTGTSERFPLAPSPSTLHPEEIVDAHVIAPTGDLSSWKAQAGQNLGGRIRALVLSLHGAQDIEKAIQDVSAASSSTPVLAIAVPFKLEDGVPAAPPSYLAPSSSSKPPIVLSATFSTSSQPAIDALAWALKQGFTVNIDIQSDLQQDSGWESFEDFLTKATASPDAKGKIILSNILPPPDDLTIPIVKLLTHPTYRSYQAHTASLSLFANLFVNFLPPAWGAPTPPTPAPLADAHAHADAEKAAADADKLKKEWKRRLKMYIGPAIEAFGFQRVLFGSSPAALLTGTSPASSAGDWYELARESFAELGVEQEAIDAVFAQNAKAVYGAES
ncbi:hypothetical protein K466DRAFT_589170 [Polyporus arcularius HHB13444]|uniref:Amidohydrolase-related domain-containing protein n=1 Tax=Polyporus arcularius HHB13444 TaxID=1314778 RepID=A0A5C3P530_9APHY|nr:hypothetical protein K466DRAFT_589170 [Polyporus arcularius HHB13444]